MNTFQKTSSEIGCEAVLGDFRALAQALGTPEGLGRLATVALAGSEAGTDLKRLRAFLFEYQRGALMPVELGLIREAYTLSARRAIRELLELDARSHRCAASPEMASASRRIGRRHLAAMRPMRDEKIVQRYLREVEAGRAHGWHTLVYGVFLALYSLPLRQGLLNYARQTQEGFVLCAVRRGQVTAEEGEGLNRELEETLPGVLKGLPGLELRLEILPA